MITKKNNEEIINVAEVLFGTAPAQVKEISNDQQQIMDDYMEKYTIVREAIREKHPKGNQFIQDTIPCPICKEGFVAFIISDHYNGHIHAKCSKGCINWME